MSRVGFVISLALLGCGPRNASPGGDCATVAAHLVELAEQDNGGSAGQLGVDAEAELEHRCRDDRWSSARRDCLVRAPNQDATLDCPLE